MITSMRRTGCAIAVVMVLAGCGGNDSDEKAHEPAPSTESSTAVSPPSPSPTYVESDTCRNGMGPLVDVMLASDEETLEYNVFDNRVKQLEKKIDAGLAPCSSAVSNPAREVMYDFLAASTLWGVCQKPSCIDDVTKNIHNGLSKARVVEYQVELVS